jgi:plasmid maintenance system antidote protein VapI
MAQTPNRIHEWRTRRALTLQQLAEAMGTNKSQIDKLEKGARRLTVEWMVRLAKPLGCDPRELLSLAPHFDLMKFGQAQMPSTTTLPLREEKTFAAMEEKAEEKFLSAAPIDQIPCPYYLMHAKDAYALYVKDKSMAPMYRPRQILFVNPYKPPVPGNGIIILAPDGTLLIRELVKQKAIAIVVRSYLPKTQETTLSTKKIAAIHTIVGATEPT